MILKGWCGILGIFLIATTWEYTDWIRKVIMQVAANKPESTRENANLSIKKCGLSAEKLVKPSEIRWM